MKSATPVDRICPFVKSNGHRCQARRLASSPFFFHDPAQIEKRGRARRAGGLTRSRPAAVLPPSTPFRNLEDAMDVKRLLADTINHTLRGTIDPKVANSAGNLCNIFLRAVDVADNAARISAIEKDLEELMSRLGAAQG
jgi:hypothetical protein